MFKLKKTLKLTALFLAVNILVECVAPSVAYALTSGPSQPEFSSFEPVATTNMVDPFSGSFTYNLPVIDVPGPNGAGYGISLSYHSGGGMEDEASWVGYGWTLNPGAISRNKSGFPDDLKGGEIDYDYKQPNVFNLSFGQRVAGDLFGIDTRMSTSVSIGTTRTFNSYKGFGRTTSVNVTPFDGLVSLDFTVGDGSSSFDAHVKPAKLFTKYKSDSEKKKTNFLQRSELVRRVQAKIKKVLEKLKGKNKKNKKKKEPSSYGLDRWMEVSRPATVSEYFATALAVDISFGVDPSILPMGLEAGLMGNFNGQIGTNSDKIAYGNMYVRDGVNANSSVTMLDYYLEKESDYNKRDIMLSVPYQGADVFSVTGEGIAGGFKYTLDDVGHYYPTTVHSQTVLANASTEFALGFNIKPLTGIGYGAGYHRLQARGMFGNGNYSNYKFNKADIDRDFDRERGYFRYTGDLSNSISYSDDYSDEAVSANINIPYPFYKTTEISSKLKAKQQTIDNESNRAYRSSYVGYVTVGDIRSTDPVNRLKSYTRDNATRDLVISSIPSGFSPGVTDAMVAELYTVNESGDTYVYGLPVFSSKETSVSKWLKVEVNNMSNETVLNPAMNDNLKQFLDYKMSETHNYPYVNSHLLTQIHTPDYIDRTFDGPTPDDFGGWTKFNYLPGHTASAYNNLSNWFEWRMPVKGYEYERGTMSHTIDDMIQYSAGLKQQYFLESIETKTHIAFFVTNETDKTYVNDKGESIHIKGSGIKRVDAISSSAAASIVSTPNPAASQSGRKLEKVILFSKASTSNVGSNGLVLSGKPLKTANLEYYGYRTNASISPSTADLDATLCKNLPNASSNADQLKGKLTLKRIWFEYEGVVNAKISPYEFFYEYKNNWATALPQAVQDKYASIINYADPALIQNPDYNPMNNDAWGNYMYNGLDRKKRFNETVPQVNDPQFDPAAWQLKRIVLPSGGEILVNYEQGDYQYVHDEKATVMVSLDPALTSKNESADNSKKYYLNLADMGITDEDEMTALLPVIQKYLDDHKMYFKFLYSLNGNTTNIGDCNVEYISGYANAKVYQDAVNHKLYVQFETSSGSAYTLPYKVCRDFNAKERKGLNLQADCSFGKRIPYDVDASSTDAIVSAMYSLLFTADDKETDVCKVMSLSDSYLRIPVLYGKKGGGIRVKHILMYDPGLETGDQMLYGSEYIYKLADNKSSSGVATNEPAGMREENVLIDFMKKRASQNFIQKITAGRDKEQFEGPMGEPLLPSPSVGYSRVVVKNIHTGKTGTGFTVQEFHTIKDHPISKWIKTTNIQESSPFKQNLNVVLVHSKFDQRYVSQGYSFVLYDIHGKPKRTATYAGDYDVASEDDQEAVNAMSYEEINVYTQPGEKVTVMDYKGNLRKIPLGRDESVTMEMRNVSDYTGDLSVKADATIGQAVTFPIPFLTGVTNVGTVDTELNTHVINKVINYTPVLKMQVIKKDGVVHTTEHKVFAISNGKPLVTVTYDGYNALALLQQPKHKGAYTSYTVPADYFYKGLSGKFKNEKLAYTMENVSVSEISLAQKKYLVTNVSADVIKKGYCTIGDLINIDGKGIFYVTDYQKNISGLYDVTIQFAGYPNTTFTDPSVTSANLNIYVIHSGFTNQLTNQAATVMTYGDDVTTLTTNPFITLSSGQKKLNAFANAIHVSAQTYKNDWTDYALNSSYNLTENTNDYLAGRTGKWRAFEAFTQKKNTSGSSVIIDSKTYDGGVFSSDVFDYDPAATNQLWTKTNTVTRYSPDGNALEEKNILNVYSAVKFGYGEAVPVAIVKNARYANMYFNGMEEIPLQSSIGLTYNNFMSKTFISNEAAHTGSQSMKIGSGGMVNLCEYVNGQVNTVNIPYTEQISSKGFMTRMWVKIADQYADDDINTSLQVDVLSGNQFIRTLSLKQIARVGEWTLVEGVSPTLGAMGVQIRLTNKTGADMFADDIRLQPNDAEMACYVYDPKTLRLLASFDDQHFALMYQYNAEGKLLRKLIETEKGVKTISEAQYNTPQKAY